MTSLTESKKEVSPKSTGEQLRAIAEQESFLFNPEECKRLGANIVLKRVATCRADSILKAVMPKSASHSGMRNPALGEILATLPEVWWWDTLNKASKEIATRALKDSFVSKCLVFKPSSQPQTIQKRKSSIEERKSHDAEQKAKGEAEKVAFQRIRKEELDNGSIETILTRCRPDAILHAVMHHKDLRQKLDSLPNTWWLSIAKKASPTTQEQAAKDSFLKEKLTFQFSENKTLQKPATKALSTISEQLVEIKTSSTGAKSPAAQAPHAAFLAESSAKTDTAAHCTTEAVKAENTAQQAVSS